jgi:hypothetical protein
MRNLWKSAVAIVVIGASLSTGLAGGSTVKAHDAGAVRAPDTALGQQQNTHIGRIATRRALVQEPVSISSAYTTTAHLFVYGDFLNWWSSPGGVRGTFEPVIIDGMAPASYIACEPYLGTTTCVPSEPTNLRGFDHCFAYCGGWSAVSIYASTSNGSYLLGKFDVIDIWDCLPSGAIPSASVGSPASGAISASWTSSQPILRCNAPPNDPWRVVTANTELRNTKTNAIILPSTSSRFSATYSQLDAGSSYIFKVWESNGFSSFYLSHFGPIPSSPEPITIGPDFPITSSKLTLAISPLSTVNGLAIPDFGGSDPKSSNFVATAYGIYEGDSVTLGVAGQRQTCVADNLGQCSVTFSLPRAGTFPVLAISGRQSTVAKVSKPAISVPQSVRHGKSFVVTIKSAPAKAPAIIRLNDGRVINALTSSSGTLSIVVTTSKTAFLNATVKILGQSLGTYRVMVL